MRCSTSDSGKCHQSPFSSVILSSSNGRSSFSTTKLVPGVKLFNKNNRKKYFRNSNTNIGEVADLGYCTSAHVPRLSYKSVQFHRRNSYRIHKKKKEVIEMYSGEQRRMSEEVSLLPGSPKRQSFSSASGPSRRQSTSSASGSPRRQSFSSASGSPKMQSALAAPESLRRESVSSASGSPRRQSHSSASVFSRRQSTSSTSGLLASAVPESKKKPSVVVIPGSGRRISASDFPVSAKMLPPDHEDYPGPDQTKTTLKKRTPYLLRWFPCLK